MESEVLKGKLQRGETVILLDVREPEEVRITPYFKEAPTNYTNLPLDVLLILPKDEIKKRVFRSSAPDEKTLIITMCRSGGRSGKACESLKQKGFRVENLEGGILEWGEPL